MSQITNLKWNLLIRGLKAARDAGYIDFPWKRGVPLLEGPRHFRFRLSGTETGTVTISPRPYVPERANLVVTTDGLKASCIVANVGGIFAISEERLSKRMKLMDLPDSLYALTQKEPSMDLIYE